MVHIVNLAIFCGILASLKADIAVAILEGIIKTMERRVTDSLARRIMTASAISAGLANVGRSQLAVMFKLRALCSADPLTCRMGFAQSLRKRPTQIGTFVAERPWV
jgi:hypothetical protein